MEVTETSLAGVLILTPKSFPDERGHFFESYNAKRFAEATGSTPDFVQDNHSYSRKGVLRGLHYQIQQAQGKLVRTVMGEAYDVVVDIRRSSPTFGRWVGVNLSAENRRQLWVPPGFAHGYLALTDTIFLYKTTDYWAPQHERCIRWDDPAIGVDWPLREPVMSGKDREGLLLKDAETFA